VTECYVCRMPIMEDRPTRTSPVHGMRHAKQQDCIDMLKAANRVLVEGGTMLIDKNEKLMAENEKLHIKIARLRGFLGQRKTSDQGANNG